MSAADSLYRILKGFLWIMGIAGILLLAFLLSPLVMAIFLLILGVGIIGLPVWIVVFFVWRDRRKKKGLPT